MFFLNITNAKTNERNIRNQIPKSAAWNVLGQDIQHQLGDVPKSHQTFSFFKPTTDPSTFVAATRFPGCFFFFRGEELSGVGVLVDVDDVMIMMM